MTEPFYALIQPLDRPGRPGRPDQGFNPDYPDQGLPGAPGRPGHLPAYGGSRPVDPGFGHGGGEHPSHRPPWHRPEIEFPPGPTDPDWGIEAGAHPEHPVYLPLDPPGQPDQGLPPVAGQLPGVLPPGSIWPPLPPGAPPGLHAFLIFISGVGYRYGVLEVPVTPGQGLPGHPGAPDQGLPGQPPAPGQGLPVRPGYPGRPDQGLPGGGGQAGQLPAGPQRDPRLAR